MTHSFKDKLACLAQWREGLLHDAELILALQCDKVEVEALHQLLNLPQMVIPKLTLTDWDDYVASRRCKDDFNVPERGNQASYIIGTKTGAGAAGEQHVVICNEEFFGIASAALNSEGQGSVYLHPDGNLVVSGSFSNPKDAGILSKLIRAEPFED